MNAIVVYFRLIKDWVFHGELRDVREQFMVRLNERYCCSL